MMSIFSLTIAVNHPEAISIMRQLDSGESKKNGMKIAVFGMTVIVIDLKYNREHYETSAAGERVVVAFGTGTLRIDGYIEA